MRILKYSTIFLCSCIILQFFGCKPDDNLQKDLGFFPLGEVRDYLEFKPGSYWIYRSDKTGEFDTIVRQVTLIDTLYAESSTRKFSHERISFTDYSQTTEATYGHSSQPLNPESLEFNWFVSMKAIKTTRSTFEGSSAMFFYPFHQRTIWAGSGPCAFVSLDTLRIDQTLYHDVARFSLESDEFWYPNKIDPRSPRTSYYWAKGFGLVKMEVHDSRIPDFEAWELVEIYLK